MSLNPALDEAKFCPRCGNQATVDYPRSITCPHCDYGAYYNPKPVAAAIPVTTDNKVILLKRGFDPGKDLWTFPGGFVERRVEAHRGRFSYRWTSPSER